MSDYFYSLGMILEGENDNGYSPASAYWFYRKDILIADIADEENQ